MKNFICKIWKDTVGSNVIASLVVSGSYVLFSSILQNFEFSVLLILLLVSISVWGLFGNYIINTFSSYTKEQKELDKKLFQKISLEIIPANRSIEFLRHHNFGGAFRRSDLEDLYHLNRISNDPNFTFINNEIEHVFVELKGKIQLFIMDLGRDTFVLENPNIEFNSVPKEWSYEQPKRFEEAVNTLNLRADQICELYDLFIKKSKKIFA